MATRKPGDQDGRDREQDAFDADERRRTDGRRDRAGEQAAGEIAGDRGGRADREQALGLADVERGRGDGPGDRRSHRAGRHHRQPGDRDDVRDGGKKHEFREEQHADDHERDPEQPRLGDPPERRPECHGDHQRDRTERDVQPRQRVGRQPAQDERVDADLADAPSHLERREDERDEPDDRDLVVAHVRHAAEARRDRSGAPTRSHRRRVPDDVERDGPPIDPCAGC